MNPGSWGVGGVLSWNVLCSHQAMVSCHMLSELEEVIQYKLVPERREIIRQIWWERLQVRPEESPGVAGMPALPCPCSPRAPCLLVEAAFKARPLRVWAPQPLDVRE